MIPKTCTECGARWNPDTRPKCPSCKPFKGGTGLGKGEREVREYFRDTTREMKSAGPRMNFTPKGMSIVKDTHKK